ncbi:hypothetical protein [Marinoscillum sp. MHG1-6]|uniref:hypothetical protein n=1 Tax=Marinoscillum sp. MHG1-6 TaxID=2959627 RepID=UPI0021574C90|nr:hypothetical protein [Marinoscillum sp. MHG1-6]
MKKVRLFFPIVAIVLLVWSVTSFNSEEKRGNEILEKGLKDFNYAIGTQTVGPKYKFTKETNLVETADQILNMGSNLLKFSMHPRYCSENYDLPKNDEIKSLTDLAIMEPSMKKVLNMDFKYYHIWVYGFSQYSPEPEGEKNDTTQIKFIGGYPENYQQALYDELYELTKHLLTTYAGTGKVFYLGNWEGDWHLRWHYDRTKQVDPKTLEGMIQWVRTRQKAIYDAKRDFQTEGVEVYFYVEVNLVKKSIEEPGSQTVANSILEAINPDYVSYSSYDATNPYDSPEELKTNLSEALDYLSSKLAPKEELPPGKRVWIGEYGSPSIKYSDDEQDERSKWVMRTGLEWGTPFILYWEIYNNEVDKNTNEHVGYWMIDDEGNKQKVWYTHAAFYKESKTFITNYFEENGELPSWEVYRAEALAFTCLKP